MENELQNNPNEDIKKLGEMIKGIKIAMLTTVDMDGNLYSRPMMTQEAEFDGTIWFFTSKSSGKIYSMRNDVHVNLSYAKPEDSRYVSVSGTVQIVDDRKKASELWSPATQAWFPKGINDPDLTLLKVSVDRAEYWDSPTATMVKVIGVAKALLTGQRYEGGGDHKKIDLHH